MMYDQNEKPITLKQRIMKDILKIVLWSIPVAVILYTINWYFKIVLFG